MTCDYCGAMGDTHGLKQCLANVQATRGQVQLQLDAAYLQIDELRGALEKLATITAMPNDVSGRAMFDQAWAVIRKTRRTI